MKLVEVVEKYKPIAATLSSHTWKSWCGYFVARWGEVDIRSIGTGEINTFIAERRKEGKSEGTIKNMLATLRILFKVARKAGIAAPWPDDIARVKGSVERVRFYLDNERERLRKIMHKLDFEIVELAASTGLRKSELWNLKRTDVNLDTRFITVVGKGRKLRRVPIGPTALKILRRILSTSRSLYVVVPLGHEHYTNRKTSMEVWMRDVWRPCRRAANIENFRWHDNRHDFASRMARNGRNGLVIKECLGVSSLQMVQRYAHLDTNSLHQGVSCV